MEGEIRIPLEQHEEEGIKEGTITQKEDIGQLVLEKLKAQEAYEKTFQSRAFKIHFFTGLTIGVVSFMVWLLQSFMVSGWPWFVYIWGAVVLTMSTHFYLFERPQKEYLPLHVMFFSVINLCAFMSWIFARNYETAWFLELGIATGIFLALHSIFSVFRDDSRKWFYAHCTLFTMINALCFVAWLDSAKGFPWFLYPIFGLSIPLYIHWSVRHPSDTLLWRLHAGLFVQVQLILFFTWAVESMAFPWFFFPLLIWGSVLAIHGAYVQRQKREMLRMMQQKESELATRELSTKDLPSENVRRQMEVVDSSIQR